MPIIAYQEKRNPSQPNIPPAGYKLPTSLKSKLSKIFHERTVIKSEDLYTCLKEQTSPDIALVERSNIYTDSTFAGLNTAKIVDDLVLICEPTKKYSITLIRNSERSKVSYSFINALKGELSNRGFQNVTVTSSTIANYKDSSQIQYTAHKSEQPSSSNKQSELFKSFKAAAHAMISNMFSKTDHTKLDDAKPDDKRPGSP